MPLTWLLLSPMLMLALARGASAAAWTGFVTVGLAVLALSCLAFVVSIVMFTAPYGAFCLRTASSISRSMLGYAGWARLTPRQRSSAAP
jgi:hypothetical protein